MDTQSSDRCPRCGEGRLRMWDELNEEERIVVRRLPANAEYSANERKSTHSWCTLCWNEEVQGLTHDV